MRQGTCDVIACDEEAAQIHLEPGSDHLLEFGLCTRHFVRVENGARPVVVVERFGLTQLAAPALLLD